ncbi:hypothetical protein K2X05_03160, partial [bacterium]|nr:hypothetical protein [bacterium]
YLLLSFLIFTSLSSFAENDLLWWSRFVRATETYTLSLPKAVRDSLSREKGFTPIPLNFDHLMSSSKTRKVLIGDFNCDKLPDYAIVGLESSTAIAKAVLHGTISNEEISRLKDEYRTFLNDKPGIVLVGLSNEAQITWYRYAGSGVSKNGILEKELLKRAKQDIESYRKDKLGSAGFDFKFVEKNRCDVLSIGCCEKSSMSYIWNQSTKTLIEVYLGEC